MNFTDTCNVHPSNRAYSNDGCEHSGNLRDKRSHRNSVNFEEKRSIQHTDRFVERVGR